MSAYQVNYLKLRLMVGMNHYLNSDSALNHSPRRMHATLRLPFELWSHVPIQGNFYHRSGQRMR